MNNLKKNSYNFPEITLEHSQIITEKKEDISSKSVFLLSCNIFRSLVGVGVLVIPHVVASVL